MNKLISIGGIVAVILCGGCERATDADNGAELEEINQLRAEMEQLTNAVGRLEFRIYELEDHHSDSTEEAMDAPSPGSAANTSDKRYDLTPVE